MLNFSKLNLTSTMAMLLITGCTTLPTGPRVMVLPGNGMTFEQFRNDDVVCQQYASFQVGGTTPNQAAAMGRQLALALVW